MRRLALIAALSGTACAYAPTVLEHLAVAEAAVAAAQEGEALRCAPEPLAHAEADLAFAALELSQGDLLRAQEHATAATRHAKTAQSASVGCATEPERVEPMIADAEPATPPDDAPPVLPDAQPALPDAQPAPAPTPVAPVAPPDADADGIADADDACPDRPETFNDYLDADGCPDVAPTRVTLTAQRILLKERVRYAPGGSMLLPESLPLLDDVRKVLVESPQLVLRIEGHTDSEGEEADNLALSQRRAEVIRAYLVEQGIPAERLIAVGFGETRPIDTNRTSTGRLNNQRVELHLVNPE